MRVFTKLNLHENTPLRVQPVVGEWGPMEAMSTRRKRRARWAWVIGFVLVVAALLLFGGWVYGQVMSAGQ